MPSLQPNQALCARMREIRRHLHRNPELAYREVETAAYICRQLTELDIPYRGQVGGTGVVATLNSTAAGELPGVALRADMDGLPLQEKTGLTFASRNPGVMHACGHDGHIAMLLGAATLLKTIEKKLEGRVVLLFQPAEETDGGARNLIAEGALAGVNLVFGGHIDLHFPVGEIAVQSGVICAATDTFRIELSGRGGHAARPHESVDPVVAASQLVVALQTLVSREVDPVRPAVLSIGRIEGGTADNIIADRVELVGTVRTTDQQVRKDLLAGLERMARQIGELYRTKVKLSLSAGYPPVVNEPAATDLARQAAIAVVGAKGVVASPYPSMGGEDFSFYLERLPGCFVRFGAQRQEHPEVSAHSSWFDFDEGVLAVGAEFLARVTRAALLQAAGKEPLP